MATENHPDGIAYWLEFEQNGQRRVFNALQSVRNDEIDGLKEPPVPRDIITSIPISFWFDDFDYYHPADGLRSTCVAFVHFIEKLNRIYGNDDSIYQDMIPKVPSWYLGQNYFPAKKHSIFAWLKENDLMGWIDFHKDRHAWKDDHKIQFMFLYQAVHFTHEETLSDELAQNLPAELWAVSEANGYDAKAPLFMSLFWKDRFDLVPARAKETQIFVNALSGFLGRLAGAKDYGRQLDDLAELPVNELFAAPIWDKNENILRMHYKNFSERDDAFSQALTGAIKTRLQKIGFAKMSKRRQRHLGAI